MKFILATLFFVVTTNGVSKSGNMKNTEPSLHYLVREPKIKSENPPLIILLHGVGSNEKDLFSFANQLPDNFLVISARAPFTLSEGSYAWYQVDFSTGKLVFNKEQEAKSREQLIQFITQLKTKHSFDEKQIYLCGFSQGAIMSYSIGLTRPNLVKGIAVMSGRILEEIKPLVNTNENLKQLTIFISHGTNDNVLGLNYAREALTFLKSKNNTPTYNEYPEGHTISNKMLNDLIVWLNKK